MNELYLSDGTVLTGKKRHRYLRKKISDIKDTSKAVDVVLTECIKLNKVEYKDSLNESVIETSENLAKIRFELEMLLIRIDVTLK